MFLLFKDYGSINSEFLLVISFLVIIVFVAFHFRQPERHNFFRNYPFIRYSFKMKEIAEILQRTKSHNRTVCPIMALERTYEVTFSCCVVRVSLKSL